MPSGHIVCTSSNWANQVLESPPPLSAPSLGCRRCDPCRSSDAARDSLRRKNARNGVSRGRVGLGWISFGPCWEEALHLFGDLCHNAPSVLSRGPDDPC